MGKAWVEIHESRLGLPFGATVVEATIRPYETVSGVSRMVRLLVEHPDLPDAAPILKRTVELAHVREEARWGPETP